MKQPRPPAGFIKAPVPENEQERLDALRAYDILDSVEEDMYDAITRAAAEVCETSLASLTFVDSNRQWFKSRLGLAARETDRGPAFCAHAVTGTDLFLVEDTTYDPRFVGNPFVVGSPYLRFYAGMPLVAPGRLSIGTLCVLDTKPRSLTAKQKRYLQTLAESAMCLLEIRRKRGVTVFAKVIDVATDGVSVSGRNDRGEMTILYANESLLDVTGVSYIDVLNQAPPFPLDQAIPEVGSAYRQASERVEPAGGECMIQTKDGSKRWVRFNFVPYLGDRGDLSYLVTVVKDITALREMQIQSQQLYAMKTTLASIAHVVNNFLNSAQLYSSCVSSGVPLASNIQESFDSSIGETRQRVAALQQMTAFRERPTPFGFSLLDPESEQR